MFTTRKEGVPRIGEQGDHDALEPTSASLPLAWRSTGKHARADRKVKLLVPIDRDRVGQGYAIEQMAVAARGLSRPGATRRVADLLEELVDS